MRSQEMAAALQAAGRLRTSSCFAVRKSIPVIVSFHQASFHHHEGRQGSEHAEVVESTEDGVQGLVPSDVDVNIRKPW